MSENSKEKESRKFIDAKKGVVLGAGLGIIFGAAFGNPGIGLVLGAASGLVFGGFSERAKKEEDN